MSKDKVSTYYDAGGIEVIDIVRAKLTPEQFKGWQLGQAITYALRAQFKNEGNVQGEIKDYEKAANYLNWLVEDLRSQKAPVSKEEHARRLAVPRSDEVDLQRGLTGLPSTKGLVQPRPGEN